MEYDVFNQYPDYLQDFDIIKSLLAMQWSAVNGLSSAGKSFLEYLRFVYTPGDRWKESLDYPDGVNLDALIRILVKRHQVVTFEDVKEFISGWIKESGYELEYDKDTMTMTLRVKKNNYPTGVYERIRSFIPCNMVLAVEIQETS